MRRLIITLSVILAGIFATGQHMSQTWQQVNDAREKGTSFQELSVFSSMGDIESSMQRNLTKGALMSLKEDALAALTETRPEAITINVPYAGGAVLTLDLLRHEVLAPDFIVTLASLDGDVTYYQPGVYYIGAIRNDQESFVAISFFNNEVMAVLSSSAEGNMVLGALENDPKQRYVLYATEDLQATLDYNCEYLEEGEGHDHSLSGGESSDPTRCVRIYFECEYNMYQEKGSVANTVNFMTGIYNVVSLLYANDGINTSVSEIFVWDIPDSYGTSTPADALYTFRNARLSFNGDVAQLVSRGAPTGGGIAWVDQLCGSLPYSYTYIYNSYSQFPTYSWTVNVVTHEMGHTLGSPHTHDCAWDMNNDGVAAEAIDGCGPYLGYSGGGSCSPAPLPTNGGTMMSYCHLISGIGVNFNYGFGPLPKALIQNRVYNSSCLSSCSNCNTVLTFNKTDIACNGSINGAATVVASGGTAPYSYLWSNGSTSSSISNLSAGTYFVTVTDANGNGCSVSESVTINEPPVILLSTAVTPESMAGISDGTIDLTVTGGVQPYTYAWTTGSTSQDLSNLAAGVYGVTVTDQNQCSKQVNVVVSSNACQYSVNTLPFSESFESGLGYWVQGVGDDMDWTRNTGSTSTNKTGPGQAYDGSWYLYLESSNGSGSAHLNSPCFDIAGFVNVNLTFAYHMFGRTMGTLTLQVSTNNGSSWSSIWSASGDYGDVWMTATVNLDAYKTGFTRLRFIATSTGGFTSDMAIDDLEVQGSTPPCEAPVLVLVSTDASCRGYNDGTAIVVATGAVPPYTYQWSNGSTNPSISGVYAGNYEITVTDSDGCDATGTVFVDEPAGMILTHSVTPASSSTTPDGAVDLNVAQGLAPYTYSWSTNDTTEDIINIPPGLYVVTVVDASTCMATDSITVAAIPPCNYTVYLDHYEGFEGSTGYWTQSTNDNFDWTLNTGSTPTKNTGPLAATQGNWYAFTESNTNSGYADLVSPCISLLGSVSPQVKFSYHLYGSQMGSLFLDISSDNGSTWTTLWTVSGDQGNSWHQQTISLASYQGYIQLRFRGVLGGVRSDMAIDGIQVTDPANQQGSLPGLAEGTWEWTQMYPNPAQRYVNLAITSSAEYTLPVYIQDALGRRVFLGVAELQPGLNELEFTLDQRASGVYYLIVGENEQQSTRLLVVTP